MKKFDVIVIGAGAAGLAAAAELAPRDLSVCVLEARDRIGGRIDTRVEPDFPLPIELGAEFVHGRSPVTEKWVHRAHSMLIDVGDGRATQPEDGSRNRDSVFMEMRKAFAKVRRPKKDLPFAEFLELHSTTFSPTVRQFARRLVEGFDAADATRVSTLTILDEWKGSAAADAPTFRPSGGYGVLVGAMLDSLAGHDVQVQLNTIVRSVHWSSRGATISATHQGQPQEISARRVVVAVPLGMLQSDGGEGSIRFSPALDEKSDALRGLAVGPVVKVMLRFETAFWESAAKGRYMDASFLRANDADFPTFWTALPARAPLLTAWAGGRNAIRLCMQKESAIANAALKSLESLFGRKIRLRDRLHSSHFHNWDTDPFARGAYSFVLAGGANARRALARPVAGTLFFAGEAADYEGEAATVAGALQSGERAAKLVLAARRKN